MKYYSNVSLSQKTSGRLGKSEIAHCNTEISWVVEFIVHLHQISYSGKVLQSMSSYKSQPQQKGQPFESKPILMAHKRDVSTDSTTAALVDSIKPTRILLNEQFITTAPALTAITSLATIIRPLSCRA